MRERRDTESQFKIYAFNDIEFTGGKKSHTSQLYTIYVVMVNNGSESKLGQKRRAKGKTDKQP